jgi:hypothetical protein
VNGLLDWNLSHRLAETEAEARELAQETWEEATADHRRELAELEQEVRDVTAEFTGRLAELNAELQERLAPYRERLESLRQAVEAEAESFEVDLPERPEPETDEADEEEWLFDAGRTYMEQLQHYRDHARGVGADDGRDEEE